MKTETLESRWCGGVALSDRNKGADNLLRVIALASILGIQFAACVLVGCWFGWRIDAWLGTSPWLMLLGLLLGLVAGMMSIYRLVKSILENDQNNT